jgi:endonuclease/exonuclease/phosphatase family metal-dependent hydrolase
MSFNLWHGCTSVNNGLQKCADAIRASGADVVGLQEATEAGGLANLLGWYGSLSSASVGLVSRYPIAATFSATSGAGARIRLSGSPLREAVLWSAHLTAYPYGPYRACRDGASVAQLLAEETSSGRLPQIQGILSAMSGQISGADSVPVFLVGDFNVPSHLDWTPSTASWHCGYVVDWPVTREVANRGLLDSFRLRYPDPAAVPAETWSPVFKAGEPQDRIDFVYFKGSKLTVTHSQTFTLAVEQRDANYQNNTWPSDHAAVISTFSINWGGTATPTATPRPRATATATPRLTATPTLTPRARPTPTSPAGCAIGAACEAETAIRGGGVVVSTLHAGYTGSGFADYQGNGTGYVEWTVSVPAAGTYSLNFRYGNGGTGDRPMSISVNGTTVNGNMSFPVTGWTNWTVRSQSANLPAGSARIRATELPNGPNVDSLTVIAGGTPAWGPNVAYAVGNLVTYGGSTYRCLQAHTSQVGWEPPNAAALWSVQ